MIFISQKKNKQILRNCVVNFDLQEFYSILKSSISI